MNSKPLTFFDSRNPFFPKKKGQIVETRARGQTLDLLTRNFESNPWLYVNSYEDSDWTTPYLGFRISQSDYVRYFSTFQAVHEDTESLFRNWRLIPETTCLDIYHTLADINDLISAHNRTNSYMRAMSIPATLLVCHSEDKFTTTLDLTIEGKYLGEALKKLAKEVPSATLSYLVENLDFAIPWSSSKECALNGYGDSEKVNHEVSGKVTLFLRDRAKHYQLLSLE